MKLYLWLFLFIVLGSCQTKSVQIIFSSQQNDSPTELNAHQIFRLKKLAANADFDTVKLADIDDYTKDANYLKRIFEPINGEYNYYQFLSTYEARTSLFPEEDLKDSIQTFHDILILKTDKENRIIDAFHYTLEWGEKPVKYDLFRSSKGGFTLTDSMNISDLKFLRTGVENENDRLLHDKGIITLHKD